jgi:hypothetical protein
MPDAVSDAVPGALAHIDLEPVVITGKIRAPVPDETGLPPLGGLALRCLPKIDGVALAMLGAGGTAPPIGVLGGLKAGYELGQCIAEDLYREQVDDSIERAQLECRDNGGTVKSAVLGSLECAVPEGTP